MILISQVLHYGSHWIFFPLGALSLTLLGPERYISLVQTVSVARPVLVHRHNHVRSNHGFVDRSTSLSPRRSLVIAGGITVLSPVAVGRTVLSEAKCTFVLCVV